MNPRNVKRFFGLFVLAFLIIFVVVIIKLPQNEDIVVTDNDLLIPEQTVEAEPEPVPEVEPVIEVIEEPEPTYLERLSLTDEDMPASMLQLAKDYRVIGMSLIVIENGDITHSYSFGDQKKAGSDTEAVPFTSDTVIRVAGVSELVSSIGVLSLCESGELDLDRPIGDFLGYTVKNPKTDAEITLRQLMTHTASVSDWGAYNDVVYGKIKYQTLKNMLTGEYAKSNFYSTKAGYDYDFSNFGSAMTGCIVSAATGGSFNSYMKSAVFAPLGIDAGYYSTEIEDRSNIATIYLRNEVNYTLEEMDEFATEMRSVEDVDNYRIAHGNLYIGASGLARIAQLILNNGSVGLVSVLSVESVNEMLATEAKGTLYKDVGTGLCVMLKKDIVPGRVLYGHGGNAYGAITELYFDPTDKTAVIITCNGCLNTTDDSGFPEMAKAFIKEVYGSVIGK
ncbi:MAG: beta-lactamase family protein [Clostridia bacterium]|nr:beta-lactamase family protein [Clostridia bacterium]